MLAKDLNLHKNTISYIFSYLFLKLIRYIFYIFTNILYKNQGQNKTHEIFIVHSNDIHATVLETDSGSIGYANIKTMVNEFRKNNYVILLDAGDTFHGHPFANLRKGETIAKVMNSMQYDAMTVGNHDFGYGTRRLRELEKLLSFPMLAANVLNEKGNRVFKPYTIKRIGELKVGIFGLATPETPSKITLANVKGLNFLEPEESARQMVDILKGKKVDLIIALSHLGLNGKFSSINLAREVSGIDIIVDGHSHDILENGRLVNDTLIVQVGEKTMNLGVVRILFKNKKIEGKNAYLITKKQFKKIKPDKNLKRYIDRVEKEVEMEMGVVIAQLDKRLDGEKHNARTKETEIGNLIAKAALMESGADAAFLNGGLIGGSLEVGKVTKGDISRVLPFENVMVIKKLRGKDLIKALENGISLYPEENGAFPHLSGITVKFDSSKKAENRIIEMKINGNDIVADNFYKIAFSEANADGGDGYWMVGEAEEVARLEKFDKILINHIKKYGFKDAILTKSIENIEATGTGRKSC